MGNFLIFILLLGILGFLVRHVGGDKGQGQANSGQVTMASTDLLSLLLQLTKASAQLDGIDRESGSEANRHKVRQLQELLDAERKRLVGSEIPSFLETQIIPSVRVYKRCCFR